MREVSLMLFRAAIVRTECLRGIRRPKGGLQMMVVYNHHRTELQGDDEHREILREV